MSDADKRKCSMCGQYKEESEYYKSPAGRFCCYCYDCRRLYNRDYKHIRMAREKDKLDLIVVGD